MANEPYITKKDLETVTQKVTVENAKKFAEPLIAQQKKNDLKDLEQKIEQKVLFQDIADGIHGLGDSLLSGLKSLIPKTDGGLSKLLGFGFGLLLAPFAGFIGFLGQLGRELNFFTRGKALKFVTSIVDKFKNTKFFKSVTALFQKVFSGKNGFFKKLGGIFKSIQKFATGGPFNTIIKAAKGIGRLLGKLFLPITILMSVFDFVKGFMKGYSEGGIIEGIKEGFNSLFEGLVGGLLRILMWIPTKIAEWLGFDRLAEEIGAYTETIIQSVKDTFGGLVDVIAGIFTLDSDKVFGGLSAIWDSITNLIMAPFKLLGAAVKDIFGGSAIDRAMLTLKQIGLSIQTFFLFLQQGIVGLLKKVPKFLLPESAENFIDNLDKGTNELKGFVDNEIEKIKDLKADLKKKEALETKLKTENKQASVGLGGGGINMQDGGTAVNTTNNVTYVIQNGNSVATDALQLAGA